MLAGLEQGVLRFGCAWDLGRVGQGRMTVVYDGARMKNKRYSDRKSQMQILAMKDQAAHLYIDEHQR